MLIDEKDCDILSFLRKIVKCLLDGRSLGLVVDDQKVLLGFCALRDMLTMT